MCFSLQESEDEFPNSSLPEETNLNETLGGTFLTLDEIGVFLSCLVGGNGNWKNVKLITFYMLYRFEIVVFFHLLFTMHIKELKCWNEFFVI